MSKPLVIITGASSGIGSACAKALSAVGHPLLLLARREDRLAALDLPNTLCRKVDVTDVSSFRDAIAEAESQFGPADCLINNAGVMLLGEVASQDPLEWKRMLEINLTGLLNGIHLVLAPMVARQQGTIINISSIAGRKTFPNHAVYCGTKYAVHGLSETLREEVSQSNVRVITIAPGAVETELLQHTTSNEIKAGYEQWKEDIGGAIAPENIAAAITYAYGQPQHVCVREIVVAATRQAP